MDVWERDLLVVQILGKCNDNYKYLLTIDISKFLHIVQLRSKTGTDVTATFRSVLAKYSKQLNIRPILVRINRGRVFEQVIPGHAEKGGNSISRM